MKQIIRLTESDLHRLISESVKRVLWESEEDDELQDLENRVKEAAEKMQALKGKRNMGREFALAAKEWRDLKDELERKMGTYKGLVNPSKEEIEKLNKDKGTKKRTHIWNKVKGRDTINNKTHFDDLAKLRINDVDAILGT